MSHLAIQGAVLMLMLLALPVTSAGTTTNATWLNMLGLAAIAVGGMVPPVLRFAASDESDDSATSEDSGSSDDSDRDQEQR